MLFHEYKDVFAWSYKDLKGIPPELGQHHIELIGAKPKRKRPYRINPAFKEQVKIELDKMLAASYIYEVDNNKWVSLIVVVKKKNGKLRICVDYRELNKVTKKDAFPLPFTEDVLERVAGHDIFSFTDGFSGYNQVSIAPEDQLKTTFVTEWGTFAYRVMPFGLTNAPHYIPTYYIKRL